MLTYSSVPHLLNFATVSPRPRRRTDGSQRQPARAARTRRRSSCTVISGSSFRSRGCHARTPTPVPTVAPRSSDGPAHGEGRGAESRAAGSVRRAEDARHFLPFSTYSTQGVFVKARVMPQNLRRDPNGRKTRHSLDEWTVHVRRDHRRRRADRHDAGRRAAAARRARARAGEGGGADPGRPLARPARAQHRGDGPARPAGAVPRPRHSGTRSAASSPASPSRRRTGWTPRTPTSSASRRPSPSGCWPSTPSKSAPRSGAAASWSG